MKNGIPLKHLLRRSNSLPIIKRLSPSRGTDLKYMGKKCISFKSNQIKHCIEKQPQAYQIFLLVFVHQSPNCTGLALTMNKPIYKSYGSTVTQRCMYLCDPQFT